MKVLWHWQAQTDYDTKLQDVWKYLKAFIPKLFEMVTTFECGKSNGKLLSFMRRKYCICGLRCWNDLILHCPANDNSQRNRQEYSSCAHLTTTDYPRTLLLFVQLPSPSSHLVKKLHFVCAVFQSTHTNGTENNPCFHHKIL